MIFVRLTILFCLGLSVGGCALCVPPQGQPDLRVGTTQSPLELVGTLTQDQHVGGVIRVTGDLRIPRNLSLYIAAGSQVYILGTDSTKIDPEYLDKGTEILVHGRLVVAGSAALPVRFSSAEETPAGESWTGIELAQAQAAVFQYVDILGAETGILSIDSSPELHQVNILGSRYGLIVQGEGQLSYAGGRISGGDAGILCFDRARLTLNELQLVDNVEEGLYLYPGCTLQAEALQVSRNDIGALALNSMRAQLDPFLSANRVDFKPLPEAIKP